MSTVRFEPLAMQLARLVPLREWIPDDYLSQARQRSEFSQSECSALVVEFMSLYGATIQATSELLGSRQFERLARLQQSQEEEYMPGGPPMSPVYDSHAIQHILGQVPVGLSEETPYSVTAHLTKNSKNHQPLHALAVALGKSHFDLYRVVDSQGLTATIEALRNDSTLNVNLTGPFLQLGDLVLARVVKLNGDFFIADSPYLLQASEQNWLDYVQRQSTSAEPTNSPEKPGNAATGKNKAQRKREAKSKQKKQPSNNRESAIVRHFHYGPTERYWLDYVADGYCGERRGIVRLAGVPDRPETLPHNEAYSGEEIELLEDGESLLPAPLIDLSEPASHRVTTRLLHIAQQQNLWEQTLLDFHQQCELADDDWETEPIELLDPTSRTLLMAVSLYCTTTEDGQTALDLLSDRDDLPQDELAAIADRRRGWFSLLRIDRVHLNSGFEVLDVLRRKKLRITEKALTRQIGTGDLIAGWLSEERDGTFRLEGGLAHIPVELSAVILDITKATKAGAPAALRKAPWQERNRLLAIPIVVSLLVIRKNQPLPEIVNRSGETLQPAIGRYRVLNRQRVTKKLEQAFEPDGDSSFSWLDKSNTRLAHFSLQGARGKPSTLLVEVNSLERLGRAKERLEQLLGTDIAPSLDSIEPDLNSQLQRKRAANKGKPAKSKALPDLPPELLEQVAMQILGQIRNNFDVPIPMFGQRTVRQLAKATRTRPDAVSWLREQERMLRLNPQFKDISLRPLWDELSLKYQGLDVIPG